MCSFFMLTNHLQISSEARLWATHAFCIDVVKLQSEQGAPTPERPTPVRAKCAVHLRSEWSLLQPVVEVIERHRAFQPGLPRLGAGSHVPSFLAKLHVSLPVVQVQSRSPA
eukprot:TRINITY_DN19767_c0_g1_i1.p2 TRINITY_DN19767_c0_g1~~TRINITY_DN19767_c0_g1_i1.p2  ORF type:complete len:111 (+),score=11.86 TRINITY_DN19767_c0_g1_i1:249-581(+)